MAIKSVMHLGMWMWVRIRWISGVTKTPEVEIKAKTSLNESLRYFRIDAIISCLAVVKFSCARLKKILGATLSANEANKCHFIHDLF